MLHFYFLTIFVNLCLFIHIGAFLCEIFIQIYRFLLFLNVGLIVLVCILGLSQYFFAILLNSISLSFFFLSVSFSIRTQTVCRNWHTSTEFKQFKKSYSNCDFFYLISLPQFFVSFSNLRNIFLSNLRPNVFIR